MKTGPRVKATREIRDKIIDLYTNKGIGYLSIGRLVKMGDARVRKILTEEGIGISPVNKTPKEKEDQIAQDYIYSGIDKTNLARKHKVTDKVIYRIIEERRLKRQIEPVYETAWERRNKKTIYEVWVNKYGKREANKRKTEMCNKMSKNSARYGKPALYGGGKSWQGWYKETYFRSLKELSYIILLEESKTEWISGEVREYVIPYLDWDGNPKTYRADFIIPSTKTMIEIKPKNLWGTPMVKKKKEVGEKWCAERGMTYVLIDFAIDTDLMIKHYKAGHIKWIPRTQVKFDEKYGKLISL